MSATRCRTALSSCTIALSLLLVALPAHAGNQEPAGINLGGTSFFDGFGRNDGGFTYITYLQYGRARRINGCNTQSIPDCPQDMRQAVFNDPSIDAFVWINQLIYTVPTELFGGSAHMGFDFLLPILALNTSFAPGPPFPGVMLTDNGVGIGDLTFGPFLQFKPVMANNRPVFSTRIEFDVVAPIGKYDPGIDINQGANFASLVPNLALTVMPLPHLEISARLNYLYNFKNFRPALGRLYKNEEPPAVKSVQAGQAGWVNFAASYEILSGFNIGVNGYYFHQFNLDLWEMLDGSSNPGVMYADLGKLSILAIGPGLFWKVAEHDKLFANVYFQTMVYQGAQSNVFNLRWVHSF